MGTAPLTPAAMASGGWGYTPNPFAAAPAQPAQPSPERPAANTGFGAWGAALGAAPPSAAPPPPPPPPGAFSIETSGGGAGVSLSQREADLARREAELARKEAAILNAADAARPKNFPPFCSIVYHNIAEQIPAWNRSMIRFHFFTELLVILGRCWMGGGEGSRRSGSGAAMQAFFLGVQAQGRGGSLQGDWLRPTLRGRSPGGRQLPPPPGCLLF
jgi:hypothetical protein